MSGCLFLFFADYNLLWYYVLLFAFSPPLLDPASPPLSYFFPPAIIRLSGMDRSFSIAQGPTKRQAQHAEGPAPVREVTVKFLRFSGVGKVQHQAPNAVGATAPIPKPMRDRRARAVPELGRDELRRPEE